MYMLEYFILGGERYLTGVTRVMGGSHALTGFQCFSTTKDGVDLVDIGNHFQVFKVAVDSRVTEFYDTFDIDGGSHREKSLNRRKLTWSERRYLPRKLTGEEKDMDMRLAFLFMHFLNSLMGGSKASQRIIHGDVLESCLFSRLDKSFESVGQCFASPSVLPGDFPRNAKELFEYEEWDCDARQFFCMFAENIRNPDYHPQMLTVLYSEQQGIGKSYMFEGILKSLLNGPKDGRQNDI